MSRWKLIEGFWRIQAATSRWGIDELLMLVAVLIIVLGTWGFIEIVDQVFHGTTQQLDEWAIRALRQADHPREPIGPRWLEQAAIDVSAVGGPTVLVLVTLAVIGFLVLQRSYGAMALVIVATSGGFLLTWAFKIAFARPRPDLVPHLTQVNLPSFPSGHSMLTAVVYLTLGTLLARVVRRKRLKLYFMMVAMLLTFLVGVSRVYVGVHYPTDVLAGWTAGLVWAVICWLGAKWLQRRGAVEENMDARLAR